MVIFKYTLVLEEISINPYMDTSVCRLGDAITVCKYRKSSCYGDCFIIRGLANQSILFVARQPSIITSQSF